MAYSKALSCLADPTRRRIFERLRTGPAPVGVVARGLPVSRPAVSQHLKVLLTSELISLRRAGTRRFYKANKSSVAKLQAELHSLWDSGLARLKREAEGDARRRRRA